MKNPLRPKWIPVLTLLAGILGIVLRRWLFTTGIDEKGLLAAAHPANGAGYVLTGLALLGIFLCAQTVTDKKPYRGLFPPSVPAAVGCWVAAVGVGFTAFTEMGQAKDAVGWMCTILGVAAAAGLAVVGIHRLKGTRPNAIFHALLTAYLMLHLVCQYRSWSSETQVSVYFFRLLGSVFLMLCAYHQATLDAKLGKLRQYLFFWYGALFFCCVTLGGQLSVFYASMAVWTALSGCSFQIFVKKKSMTLPEPVQLCLERLNDKGFEAYAVGGCVRDSLLGLTPQDYDLCTDASPRQIAKLFSDFQLVRSGEKHGTIGVVIDHTVYEITTFRTEGGYSDRRHPDWVKFVKDVKDDPARRDFTVNAMAYSPVCGYVDPFGGQMDLEEKVLRTVGEPTERFQEDALRILRGVRFAARFRLTPHPETEAAMTALAPTMDSLAQERIFSELCKLLICATAEDLIRYTPVLTQVIPELAPTVDFEQHTVHHRYDVYTHTAYVVEAAEPILSLRWAALLHDIGKPATFTRDADGTGHFYSHAAESARLAEEVLHRLRAPNALREQVVTLIKHHMEPLTPEQPLLRRRLAQLGMDTLRQLVALQKADRIGTGTNSDETDYVAIDGIISALLEENACLKVKDLAVGGNDLMELGFAPGPVLGQTLDSLLEMVLDGKLSNEKAALLAAAEKIKEKLQ